MQKTHLTSRNLASRFCLLFLCFLAFIPSSIYTFYDNEEYEGKQVASIRAIPENLPKQETFNQTQFLAKLRTKVGDPFSQLIFDQDLKTLSQEYDRAEPLFRIEGTKLYIDIKVWLKPMIRSIRWEGNESIKTSKLQKELGIKINTIFQREEFNKAFAKVKDYYIKKGFFASELTYKILPYREANAIDIEIHIEEGHSSNISSISFDGLSKKDERAILKMMTTKRYNLFTSWITGTGTYQEEALDYDRLVIVNYLQNQGFANAQVELNIEETDGGRIAIHINATKGALFSFGSTTVEGNILFDDAKIIQAFGIHQGDVFSPEKLQLGIRQVRDLYGKDGYIEAKIDSILQLSADKPVYNVVIQIEEGDRFRIGLVRVLGNTSTKSNVILRESLLVPGEVFDSRRLQATEMRLMGTGYFKSVNVYAVKTAEDDELGENYRDVVIEVEETTTGSINLFFGFSTQENLIGGIQFSEQNFDHRGLWKWWREGISSFRGAGELATLRAQIGAKQQSYTLQWLDPHFMDTNWRFGFTVAYSNNRLIASDYDVKAISGQVNAYYPINDYWTVGANWRIRSSTIEITNDNILPSVREQQENNEGIVTGILPSIVFDSTNRIIKPTRGFKSTLEGQFAYVFRRKHYPVKSFPFLSASYLNAYCYPIWAKGTVSMRANCQFLFPLSEGTPDLLPVNERYFLGGENTVRGYKRFRIGPKFAPAEGREEREPKGGISSVLLSLQYTQFLHAMVDVFWFIDAGALSDERFHIPSFNASTGVGLNLTLLNGVPITGGFALPINADKNQGDKSEDFQYFFFSMGGQF